MTTEEQASYMDESIASDSLSVRGQVSKRVYDLSEVRDTVDNYDELSREKRIDVLRGTEPVEEETVDNVTVDRFHEYFVDNLNRNNTSSVANLEPTHIAVGGNGSAGISESDTQLNTRLYNEEIDTYNDIGKTLVSTILMSSSEGNGNTYNEIGIFTGDPANVGSDPTVFMLNHTTFSDFTKDNTKSITFDVSLTFGDS